MHLIIQLTAYTSLCHGYFTPGIENQNGKFALLSLRIPFVVFTNKHNSVSVNFRGSYEMILAFLILIFLVFLQWLKLFFCERNYLYKRKIGMTVKLHIK